MMQTNDGPAGPEIWTARNVARWCGASVRTVLNWIERGDLKSFKLPGRGDNRIRQEDLVEFLGRHQMPVPRKASGSAPRVLVVDDDPRFLKITVKALKLDGYEVETAKDGFSAGAALGSFAPDLVVLDLNMPGLTGHEVIRIMKGTPKYREIRILVVSSMPREELDRARAEGADDACPKSMDYKVLQEKIDLLLGRGGPDRRKGGGAR